MANFDGEPCCSSIFVLLLIARLVVRMSRATQLPPIPRPGDDPREGIYGPSEEDGDLFDGARIAPVSPATDALEPPPAPRPVLAVEGMPALPEGVSAIVLGYAREDPWIAVANFPNAAEMHLAAAILDGPGIPARLDDSACVLSVRGTDVAKAVAALGKTPARERLLSGLAEYDNVYIPPESLDTSANEI